MNKKIVIAIVVSLVASALFEFVLKPKLQEVLKDA